MVRAPGSQTQRAVSQTLVGSWREARRTVAQRTGAGRSPDAAIGIGALLATGSQLATTAALAVVFRAEGHHPADHRKEDVRILGSPTRAPSPCPRTEDSLHARVSTACGSPATGGTRESVRSGRSTMTAVVRQLLGCRVRRPRRMPGEGGSAAGSTCAPADLGYPYQDVEVPDPGRPGAAPGSSRRRPVPRQLGDHGARPGGAAAGVPARCRPPSARPATPRWSCRTATTATPRTAYDHRYALGDREWRGRRRAAIDYALDHGAERDRPHGLLDGRRDRRCEPSLEAPTSPQCAEWCSIRRWNDWVTAPHLQGVVNRPSDRCAMGDAASAAPAPVGKVRERARTSRSTWAASTSCSAPASCGCRSCCSTAATTATSQRRHRGRALAAVRPDIVTYEEFAVARHTKLWNYDAPRWTRAITRWLAALPRD